ncbi:MAG TPA: hypothetical protein VG123_41360 [Streptosporangiaceae bacterium]|jgi:hypothetical protein|nr:hypothetical protein [Streptosporangiaceae bacterium]
MKCPECTLALAADVAITSSPEVFTEFPGSEGWVLTAPSGLAQERVNGILARWPGTRIVAHKRRTTMAAVGQRAGRPVRPGHARRGQARRAESIFEFLHRELEEPERNRGAERLGSWCRSE